MNDYFDWTTIEDDVVIPEQAAIAVYTNPNGGIVCRQAGQYGPEEDSWIFFHPSHALALARAILDRAGLDMEIVPLTSLLVKNRDGVLMRPFPNQDVIDNLKEVENAGPRGADLVEDDKDDKNPAERKRKAAAERQRRRREKRRQRDSVTDAVTVTPLVPELDLDGVKNKALAH